MRASLAVVALLAAGACAVPGYPPPWVTSAAAALQLLVGERSHASCVPIDCRPLPGGGYLVVFLTARHAVEVGNVRLRTDDGAVTGPPAVVRPHPELDAALVAFVLDRPAFAVPLRESPLRLGEPAWVSGYGGGKGYWISQGLVCGSSRVSAPTAPGDSGGAVLDAEGRLIGIVEAIEYGTSSLSPFPQLVHHHTLHVPVRDMLQWVRSSIGR